MSFLSGNEEAIEPPEMLELALCERFGWTINELNDQPANKITRFLQILNAKEQFAEMKNKTA
jgi:hypothetical protein